MIRLLVFSWLIVLAWAARVEGAPPESPVSGLLERPRETLRGELIDPSDPWDAARLLARFGEISAAYDLLRQRPHPGYENVRVERFEARLLTEMGLYERADSLLALRHSTLDTRERYLHYLWRSRLNAMAGRYERALDFIGCLPVSQDTVFEPYRDLIACEALMTTQGPAAAGEVAERRLSRGVPSSMALEFETILFDAYMKSGRPGQALELLKRVKTRPLRRSVLAPLVAREVDIRFVLGDTLGAIDSALELVKTYGTPAVVAAVESVLSRVPMETVSTRALLSFGGFLLRYNRKTDVERLVKLLSGRSLEDAEKEEKRLLYGELLYKQKRYTQAAREIRAPFADPASERKAKLLRARIYRGAGERVKSAEAYEAFAKAFPYDRTAPEALWVAWDMQHEAGRRAKAASILRTIVETYPSSEYSHLATLRISLDHVERQEYTLGARVLERALEARGRDDPAFLYYLADVYGKMGNAGKRAKLIAELAALDSTSFYLDPRIPSVSAPASRVIEGVGDLSNEQGLLDFLKRVLEKRDEAYRHVQDALEPWEDWPPAPGESADGLVRARAFVEMGFRDWGDAEFRAVEAAGERPPRADLALGVLYDDFGIPWRSIRAIQRVYYSIDKDARRGLERDFKVLTFPVFYPSTVFDNCIRDGIAPHLVYAMIREESRFDERAVSAAGAMGLMQIMPATGDELADQIGLPDGVHHDLFSPDVNLSFGVRHASRLLELSGRDPLKMLAAYNAGPANAARWFNDRTVRESVAEQVDGIDFGETRAYVKRIVESAHVYYTFYFSPASASGEQSNPDSPNRNDGLHQ